MHQITSEKKSTIYLYIYNLIHQMIFCLTVISVREFIQIIQICECIFLGFGTSLEALTTIIAFVNQLHDEGYSRNVSFALILISTFLLQGFMQIIQIL